MDYTPTVFVNVPVGQDPGSAPDLDAGELNKLGDGIQAAHVEIAGLDERVDSLEAVEPPDPAPDATTSTKGVARLLGGTADAPTVPWSAVTDAPTIITYGDEQARDAVGAALVEGPGIDIAVDDAGNTITISTTGLAAVATSGSASDITTGTLPDSVIPAGVARDSEVATQIAALVNAAPGTLDTLGEIASALQADESAAATLAATVGGKAAKSANLSDLTSTSAARANLGLGNVDNTSDANKPISTATQAALNLKATSSTLAAVATSGSASDITTGTLPDSVIPAGIARDAEVASAVAALVNSAPGTLDTLGEIATQLAADESTAAALATTVGGKAAKAANLSDLVDAPTARTNLGLGNVATRNVGTTTGTAAAGDDSRFADTRTPTDGSVTDAKVASGAAIALSKLATDPLARTNHTGTQAISTVTGLQTALDAKASLIETVNTVAVASTAQTLPDTATIHDLTLTSASCALTFPTLTAGRSFTLVLRQDGTGSRAVAWPSAVKWAAATAPTLTTTASAVDVISVVNVTGSAWLAFVAGKDMR